MPVYVSTSCLANGSNVFDVLEAYAKAGLRNIELGSIHNYISDLSPAKFTRYGFNLIAHHYFPPPHEPLMVNLASQDSVILKRSKDQIKKSIEFCHSMGIKLFTFHAGFRADPNEKLEFIGQPVTPYEIAFDTFVESIGEIDRYAQDNGVEIAIENNALSEYNLVDGKNPFLLLCEAEEFERLWEKIPSANVGMLLDLGHLKVTSHWLGFDRYEFIDRLKNKVFSIHIHDNKGKVDEHLGLSENSWCLKIISRNYFKKIPIVFEGMNLSIHEIIRNKELIEKQRRE